MGVKKTNKVGDLKENEGGREAIESEDSQLWLQAMSEEIESLRKNKTWILVDQPKKQKVVGCKWIFKKKEDIPGVERPRFKGRSKSDRPPPRPR